MIKDTISNLFGVALPAVAALFAIPFLIQQLGVELFGIFSLQMAILFFLGISDFGISKAIVLLSFQRDFAGGHLWKIPFLTGTLYSVILFLILSLLAASVWTMSLLEFSSISPEILRSTAVIILSSALMLLTLPFRAVYEVEQKFFLLNLIKGPAAATLFLAPFVGFLFEISLESAAWSILGSRVVFLLIFAGFCSAKHEINMESVRLFGSSQISPSRRSIFVQKAFAFGITNFASLLISYLDRFLIAFFVSSVAVSHFVVAQEVASKLWLIIGAAIIASVPKIAGANEKLDLALVVRKQYELKLLVIAGGYLPAVLLIIFADDVLKLWLQSSYSWESALPLQIMAVGIAINSLSQVNFVLLQIFGGEARGAKLQVVNLFFALATLPILIPIYSIVGAAVAFTIRLFLDAIAVRILLNAQDPQCRIMGVSLGSILIASSLTILIYVGTRAV